MTRTIDMTPTFAEAATMLLALFQSGTPEGRSYAEGELRRWGDILDAVRKVPNPATDHTILTNLPHDAPAGDVGRLKRTAQEHTEAAFYIDRATGLHVVAVRAAEGGAILRDVVTSLDRAGFLG